MSSYGFGDGETIITEYLDSHLENGIKQKNLESSALEFTSSQNQNAKQDYTCLVYLSILINKKY